MGNVSYKFLTILLTVFLPLIIFLNLLAFGHVFGGGVLTEDKYFGVSSLFNSLTFFQTATADYGFDFFSPQSMNEFAINGLNHLTFGIEKFWTGIVNGKNYLKLVDGSFFNFSDFPVPTELINFKFDTSDVIKILIGIVRFFSSVIEYVFAIADWLYAKLGIFGVLMECAWTVVLQPILIVYDMLFIILYLLYYLLLLFMWVIKLINGEFSSTMPSMSDSSWSSMINDWEDTWSSIVPQAKVFLPPLQCVC